MSDLPFTDDPVEVARRVDALRSAVVDNHIAEGKMPRAVHEAQASLQNEVHRVYFRAGLLACREYMARFVEAQSPQIAASIRANWWPGIGEDPGTPRRLQWSEVADGGDEGPWEAINPGLNVEALPVALNFLCATSGLSADAYEAGLSAAPAPSAPADQKPMNGIPATWAHDEGAYAQCGDCGRYSADPDSLRRHSFRCDCGSVHGWSGSFKKPGPDAKWSGAAPADQPSPDKQGQQGDDTARLDWLEEYFTDVHGVYVDADKTVKAFFVDCEDDTMGSNKYRIRSAIDAARLAASPAPTEEPRTDGGAVPDGAADA